jgi:predicted Zn-dependent protease
MNETARPTSTGRRAPVMRGVAVAAAIAVAATGIGPVPQPAHAQDSVTRGMPIIRDTEIENLLRDYAAPILHAAGLAKQNVKVVVLNERSFNAFVMDGRHIFINAGALFDAKTPNEVIGVFAHETGHLAGGHLMRMREEMSRAQTAAIVALLLGVGATVAASRSPGAGDVGAVAMTAPQSMIMRSLLAYVRTQEDQADHAGVKFLTETHQSPKGMLDLFKRLANESLFNSRNVDPYLQSHPLPAERVATLDKIAHASPYFDVKDPPALQHRHDMMRAKLAGFLERPETVARRFPQSDQSLPARYARAISAYRHSDLRSALTQIDALIQAEPNNTYFYELKGQALLEGAKPAEAVAPLRHAAQLSHDSPLIAVMLAQAMLESKATDSGAPAVALLQSASARDPEVPGIYRLLAQGYAREKDYARADLASAQDAAEKGDIATAKQLASRAKTSLPVGSPAWVRADDITNLKPPKKSPGN